MVPFRPHKSLVVITTIVSLACLAYTSHRLFVAPGVARKPTTYREREEMLGNRGIAADLSISNAPITISVDDLWQTGPYCGANCMYAWLTLKGLKVSYNEVKSKVKTAKQGANLLEMRNVGRSYGFEHLDVYDVPEERLRYVRRPFIALLKSSMPIDNLGHYVLVSKVDDHSVYAIDGTSAGYVTSDRAVFGQGYKGYVLAEGVDSGTDRGPRHRFLWLTLAFFIGANLTYSAAQLAIRFRRGQLT
jgi:hypothetical protein